MDTFTLIEVHNHRRRRVKFQAVCNSCQTVLATKVTGLLAVKTANKHTPDECERYREASHDQ